jgi:hypothetical protein
MAVLAGSCRSHSANGRKALGLRHDPAGFKRRTKPLCTVAMKR